MTMTGADRAVPGVEEGVLVSVTSHPSVTPARPHPSRGRRAVDPAAGRGPSVQQVLAGVRIVVHYPGHRRGRRGQPLPRTPLEVVGVRPTGSCAGVGFQVNIMQSITATWTTDAPGADVHRHVLGARRPGRVTNAERDGRVLLDLLGYPKPPASISQAAYADGTVTLRVDPGQARLAYPLRSPDSSSARAARRSRGAPPTASARPSPPRTASSALYEAWAVNGVGESKGSVRTLAWAYDAPLAPTKVTAAPVVTGDGAGGIVSLVIDGIETGETGSLEISSPAGEVVRVGVGRNETRVDVPWYRVGSNTGSLITVTPYSRFDLPPGLGGSASGAAATVQANGIGRPLSPQLTLSSVSNGDGSGDHHGDGVRCEQRRRLAPALRHRPGRRALHGDRRRSHGDVPRPRRR